MGKYRFKLSKLIPNAWFFKLRDMGKSRNQQRQLNSTVSSSPTNKHHAVPTPNTKTAHSPRHSSYYSRPPPSTLPAGSRLRRRATVHTKSSAPKHVTSSALCCRANRQLDFSTTSCDSNVTGMGSFSSKFRSDQALLPDDSVNCSRRSPCSSAISKLSKAATFTPPLEHDLRRIITKSANKFTNVRKTAVSSPAGLRLRLQSPRISRRKSMSSGARRSGSSWSSGRSRAVVKASVDPRRDFKESMEEMIAENNIIAPKDLEELLACYLCLNSDEYHVLIITVFKQIWLHLNLPPHIPNKLKPIIYLIP